MARPIAAVGWLSVNPRIIENRTLRDSIIQFYELVERRELIVQKYNDEIVDGQRQGQLCVCSRAQWDICGDPHR